MDRRNPSFGGIFWGAPAFAPAPAAYRRSPPRESVARVAREGHLALAEGFAPSRSGRRHFVVCWPSFAAAAAVVRAAAVGDSEPRRTSSMLRKTVAFLFLAGLATAASAQTADDLIEKNI